MKTKIVIFICFVWCLICCGSNAKRGNASSSEKLEGSQDELVHYYANALDSFAQVIPKFGQDTEAEWAADTVHAMAASLKGKRYSYYQSMAIISQMQNYLAMLERTVAEGWIGMIQRTI